LGIAWAYNFATTFVVDILLESCYNVVVIRCRICGKREKFDFHVPDEIWEAVVGEGGGVVCLSCFDDLAKKKEVQYAASLGKEVYFAGDQATFILQVVRRIEDDGYKD